MQIPHDLPQFEKTRALIVVSAKEEGVLYFAHQGALERIEHVAEHPPTHSDREGFFFRTGHGKGFGSGAPLEEDDYHNLKQFIASIASEINAALKEYAPDQIYIFEPEHFKGYLQDELANPTHVPVHHVRFGNYVHEEPLQVVRYIAAYENDALDPGDPRSVEGEKDAAEKRKILSLDPQKGA